MQKLSLDTIPVPNPNVVGRVVSDEAVLVLPQKGTVKVLNEVGARIWSLVDGVRSAREIASLIFSEYNVEQAAAEEDTLVFLGDLADRDVLTFKASV
jgi:hypothetical protein